MDLDRRGANRRRVLLAAATLAVPAGCMDADSLEESLGLRVTNASAQLRRLDVVVERVGDEQVYEGVFELEAGETAVEETVVSEVGRYRVEAVDRTAEEEDDEENDGRLDAELSTGTGYCGWFTVRAEDAETMVVSLPRCPEADGGSDE